MSNKEIAIDIINQIPEYKLVYVVDVLKDFLSDNKELNKDTIDAIEETTDMQENGKGQHYEGSTKDFFKMLMNE